MKILIVLATLIASSFAYSEQLSSHDKLKTFMIDRHSGMISIVFNRELETISNNPKLAADWDFSIDGFIKKLTIYEVQLNPDLNPEYLIKMPAQCSKNGCPHFLVKEIEGVFKQLGTIFLTEFERFKPTGVDNGSGFFSIIVEIDGGYKVYKFNPNHFKYIPSY